MLKPVSKKFSFDLIIPCYNPPDGWARDLVKYFQEISQALANWQIQLILVNDGSSQCLQDDIAEIESCINFTYIHYSKNKGKGYALRQGATKASAPIQIYTDIDFPYTTASLVSILETLHKGEDIAVGVREAEYYQHVPPIRTIISRFAKALIKYVLRIPIADTQCGLKGFNVRGRSMFVSTQINRFLFDMEFIYLAAKQKDLNIKPIVVHLREGVSFSKMGWRILLGEGINFLRIIFLRRFK